MGKYDELDLNKYNNFTRIGFVKKAAIYTFMGIIFSKLFSYVFRLIVSRLGAEEYGTFSLGFAIYGFAIIFSMLGLHDGVLRYIPYFQFKGKRQEEKGTIKTAILGVLACSGIVSLLMFTFAGLFAKFFGNPGLILVIRTFSIALPFMAMSLVLIAALRSNKRVKEAVMAQYYADGFTKIMFAAILIYLGFGIFGAVSGFIFSSIIVLIIAYSFLRKQGKIFEGIFVFKQLLSYSVPLMFSGFLYFIIYYTDTLMLGYFKDTTQVGIYNIALPTAGLLFIMPEAIHALFVPLMTKYYVTGKKKKFESMYRKSFWFNFILNLPVFIALLFFSKQIIQILFGEEYILGSAALSILAIGYFFRLTFIPNSKLLEVFKKQNVILYITIIASIMNIILNYLLIPGYGMIGGAIATSTTYIFIGIATYVFSRDSYHKFVNPET